MVEDNKVVSKIDANSLIYLHHPKLAQK